MEWEYQRKNAESAIETLNGVRSVLNLIVVKPRVTEAGIEHKISAAFHRSATIDAEKVNVDVIGNKVTLRGTVRSFAEKQDAESAAWEAPGVNYVENRLVIHIPEYVLEV